jgi:hypothetical protein
MSTCHGGCTVLAAAFAVATAGVVSLPATLSKLRHQFQSDTASIQPAGHEGQGFDAKHGFD